jgi:TP901 family phage tail tape measure protein
MAVDSNEFMVKLVVDSSGAVKGFKDANGNVVEFSSAISSASRRVKNFGGNLEALQASLAKLGTSLQAAGGMFGAMTTNMNMATGASEALNAAMMAMGTHTGNAAAGAGNAAKSVGEAGTAAQSATSRFTNFTISVTGLNQAINLVQGTLSNLQFAFGATLGKGVEFEKGMAEVQTLMTDTERMNVDVSASAMEFTKVYGTEQKDIIKAYYQTLSSGAVDAAHASGILDTAQRLAIGGVTSLHNAVDGLTAMLQSYNLKTADSVRVSDAMFIAARDGRTTIDELAKSVGHIAPLAAQMRVSFEELLAAVSTITTAGVSTSEAVTQVRSALLGLARQTREMPEHLKKIGVSSVQMAIQQRGLVQVMRDLMGSTGGSTEELVRLFGRIEAVNAMAALTSDTLGNRFNKTMDAMAYASGHAGEVTNRAFGIMVDTVDHRLRVAMASLNADFVQMFEMLKGIGVVVIEDAAIAFQKLELFLKGAGSAAMAFRGFDWGGLAAGLLGVASAIGVLAAVSGFAGLVSSLGSVTAALIAIEQMGIPLLNTAKAMTTLGIETMLTAGKFTIFVASVGALILSFSILQENIDKIPNALARISNSNEITKLRDQMDYVKFSATSLGKEFNKAHEEGLMATMAFNASGKLAAGEIERMSGAMIAFGNAGSMSNDQIQAKATDVAKALAKLGDEQRDLTSSPDSVFSKGLLGRLETGMQQLVTKMTDMGKPLAAAADESGRLGMNLQDVLGFDKPAKTKKNLDEVLARLAQLQIETAKWNGDSIATIKAQEAAELQKIKVLEKDLSLLNQLTPAAQQALKAAQEALGKHTQDELQKALEANIAMLEKLGKLRIDNAKLTMKLDGETVARKLELISLETGQEYAAIDRLEQELKSKNKLNDANKELIKQARELIGLDFEKKIDDATPVTLQGIVDKLKAAKAEFQDFIDKSSQVTPQQSNDSIGKFLGVDAFVDMGKGIFDGLMQGDFDSVGYAIYGGFDDFAESGVYQLGEDLAGAAYDGLMNADLGAIGGVIGDGLVLAAEGLAALMNPETINNLADGLQSLQNAPQQLVAAFTRLDSIVTTFIDKFPAAVASALAQLPALIGKIFAQLPALVDALVNAFVDFINHLPDIAAAILDHLPDIVDRLAARLPDIITALAAALPEVFAHLLPALVETFGRLMERLPDIVAALTEGLISAAGDMAIEFIDYMLTKGGVEKIVGALLRAIPRIAMALVNGILAGLGGLLGKVLGGGKMFDTGGIEKAGAVMAEQVKKVANIANDVGQQVFGIIDLKAQKRAAEAGEKMADLANQVKDAFKNGTTWLQDAIWLLQHWIDSLGSAVSQAWKAILDFFSDFGSAIGKAWHGIVDFFTNLFGPLASAPFNGIIDLITNKIGPLVGAAWKGILDLFNGFKDLIGSAFQATVDFWKNIFSGKITEAFSGILKFFKEDYAGFISKAWKTILDFFGGATGTSGLIDKVSSAFKPITDFFNSATGGLAGAVTKAFSGAINALTGIGKVIWDNLSSLITSGLSGNIQGVLDALNPINLFNKMFDAAGAGGQGKVESILGIDVPFIQFARGGMVPGVAPVSGDSKTNDRILAMVSAGEAVIPRSLMANPWVRRMVSGLLDGSLHPPAFATGGIIGKVLGGGGGGGGGLGGLGSKLGDLGKAGVKGFEDLGALGQDKLGDLGNFLGGLDPSQLWNKVMDKVADSVWSMFSAHKFAQGGLVGDRVPGLFDPREFVLRPQAVAGIGPDVANFINRTGRLPNQAPNVSSVTIADGAIRIEAGPQANARDVADEVMRRIERATLDGGIKISSRSIRSD